MNPAIMPWVFEHDTMSENCSGLHRPLRQGAPQEVGMFIVREPMSCNGSTLAQNARDVGSSPLGTIFPIFITPMTLGP